MRKFQAHKTTYVYMDISPCVALRCASKSKSHLKTNLEALGVLNAALTQRDGRHLQTNPQQHVGQSRITHRRMLIPGNQVIELLEDKLGE